MRLPKAIREQRRWPAVTRLTVHETPEGVLLRHLAGSTGCTDFVSFDRRLARRAAALRSVPVVEP